jgi:hypothetical protein
MLQKRWLLRESNEFPALMLLPNIHQFVNKRTLLAIILRHFNVARIFIHCYPQIYFNVIKGRKYEGNEDKYV